MLRQCTDLPSLPSTHGGAYPAGGPRADDDDWSGAADHASQHAGDSGNADLFGSLLGALGQKKQRLAEEDIDEDGRCFSLLLLTSLPSRVKIILYPRLHQMICGIECGIRLMTRSTYDTRKIADNRDIKEAVRTHKKYFQDDDDNDADDRSMGSAAAMQALKMFTSGQSGNDAVCQLSDLRNITDDDVTNYIRRNLAVKAPLSL